MKSQVGRGTMSGCVNSDCLPREILTLIEGSLFGFRQSNQRRAWDDLPSEILTLIKGRLFGKDIASFRLVCTHWSLAPASLDEQISDPISEIVKYPLLLRFRRRKNQLEDSSSSSSYCEVYSPAYNKTYALEFGSGSGSGWFGDARIMCCKFGWLLLSQGTRFFFLHPTSGHLIKLTASLQIDDVFCFNRMSFSAPPTSPDCLVLGLDDTVAHQVYVGFTRRGDTFWTIHYLHEGGFHNKMKLKFNNRKKKNKKNFCKLLKPMPCILKGLFDSSNSSSAPVFHNGAFYSLGSNGRLGVFDPRRKKKNMWRLLDTVHDAFSFDDVLERKRADLCETYLMELSNSSLISVVVGWSGEDVRVVKFNDKLKKWQRVSCLEDRVIFLSRPSSIVMRCEELGVKGLENTIHFPRFHQGGGSKCYNVFYSLHSGKFHSFEGRYVSQDLCDTKLALNCTWILPDFQQFNDEQLNWSLIEPPRSIGDGMIHDPLYFIQHLNFLPRKKSHRGRKVVEEEEEQVSVMRKPWIIILQESKGVHTNVVAVDLCTGVSHSYEDNRLRGMNVFGCRYGRVLLMDQVGDGCFLLDTSSMTIHRLPAWKTGRFLYYCCVLYPSPQASKVVVIVFAKVYKFYDRDGERNYVNFCRVGDKEWTTVKSDYRVLEAVFYQGTIYGILEGHKFARIEIEPEYKVNILEKIELPMYKIRGCITKWYMVESGGELFCAVMYIVASLGGQDVMAEIRMYKIDVKEMMRFEEVAHLGDKAFFFDRFLGGRFECCASKFGLQKNNIYYVNEMDNKLYRYDYEDGCVSFSGYCRDMQQSCENKFVMYY